MDWNADSSVRMYTTRRGFCCARMDSTMSSYAHFERVRWGAQSASQTDGH